MSSDKLFVVAIDFGTTYSGYAFSNIHKKQQIFTYSWVDGATFAPKTPTSILFNPRRDFDSFGYEAEEKYATLSQQGESGDWYFFKRFKMTLYKVKNLSEQTTIKDYSGKQLPALRVFSAGIKYLKDHLFSHFQLRVQQLRDRDIQWVVTVPAIWDEAAKKFMRKAAEEAGIPGKQLTLALEPESAALYCQSGIENTDMDAMNPGDKFLLLDCGGGTVDVTVHEVRYDQSLKEIHRASGGPWGGIKVDDAFQEYLLELFGFETIETLDKRHVIELERSFESLKKKVDIKDTVYYLQIPLSLRSSAPAGTLLAGRLKLSSAKVKSFFARPIKKIREHIQSILDSLGYVNLNAIVLVGGFSESKLLQAEIRQNFRSVHVHAPSDPASAVIKGAVEFGHNPEKIRFRMSPYTYGIGTVVPFVDGIHPPSKLIKINGEEYCDDYFDVHVRKNKLVETGTPISEQDYQPMYTRQTCLEIQVVQSELERPKYVTDVGSKIIGSFDVQIPRADSGFKRSVNVKMIFSGTELKIEARDRHSKQLYTSAFEFE